MNKKDIDEIIGQIKNAFATHEACAIIHVDPFAQLLMDKPDEAINHIFDIYDRALDDAYTDEQNRNCRAFIEAIAGGPYETIPWALYNAVGAAYPFLEREQKNNALTQILNILDGRNYAEVNGARGAGHTTGIREPLLLSDIAIARPLYWPGLHEEENLWKKCSSFEDFKKQNMNEEGMFKKDRVKSDFIVAYSLLRSDLANFGEDYIKAANPDFLERTLQGIVGMRFARTKTPDEIKNGRERLHTILPKSTHEKIETLMQKADWVDYKLFNPHEK